MHFGNVLLQFVEGNLPPAAVRRANPCTLRATVPNNGWHGGDGDKARGKNRLTNQSADQSRFAALELADAGNVESAFCKAGGQFAGFAGNMFTSKFRR